MALMLAATAVPTQAAPPTPSSGDVQPQISGGSDVPNDAYPFTAALLIKEPGNALGELGAEVA